METGGTRHFDNKLVIFDNKSLNFDNKVEEFDNNCVGGITGVCDFG
jgi:hypothetical protein